VIKRFLSPSLVAALRLVRDELKIWRYHRQGLAEIKRRELQRSQRLNLGSGGFTKQGFLNVDMLPGADLTLDLRRGLPFESNSCRLIFSEHFFEHLEYPQEVTALLRDCYRVLQPGGTLKFSVPDTEWPIRDYPLGDDSPYIRTSILKKWHPPYCTTRIEHVNAHFREGNEHKFVYDEETATKLLKSIGFVDVQRSSFDPTLNSSHREPGSLHMIGRKPAPDADN
jgi:predicted SAM-dependent methyltransferase